MQERQVFRTWRPWPRARAGDDMSCTTSGLDDLLAECQSHGIRLLPDGDGRLTIDAPQDALTPDVLARLKAHKADLLAMLRPAPDLTPVNQSDAAAAPRGSADAPGGPGIAVGDFAGERADETEHVPQRRLTPRGGDWPADLAAAADFALLLSPEDLPATPFDFGGPHCTVVDGGKFLSSLQADVRRGPAGPRAMYGAIQGDLRRLRGMLATTARQSGQHRR